MPLLGRGREPSPPLAREVIDGLSEDVLRVSPPPVPVLMAPWSARLAQAEGADLNLVHRWMNEPHVASYWDQAWTRTRWSRYLVAQLAGTYSRPLIIEHQGMAVAYVELYRAARDIVSAYYPADPFDVGSHMAIGERAYTGRSLGPHLQRSLIDAIFVADPLCRRVVCEPDVRNYAARRKNDKAGLRLLGEVDLPHKRAAIFVFPRSEEDMPEGLC